MSTSVLLLLCLAGLVLIFSTGLQVTGNGAEWRWLRWPLAFGIVALSLLALTTSAWPDGLGVKSCSEVVNPALEADASAQPHVIVTCEPIPATGAATLFTVALILMLVSPELGEFGVPGLLSLKKRVTETEQKTEKLTTRIEQVQTAAASALADTRVSNEIAVTVEAARQGKATPLLPAYSEAVRLSIEAILTHGNRNVEHDTEFVHYKHIGGGLLRQYQYDESHITDFQSGNGATGQAWKDEKTIVVTGESVHNAEYGLSDEQQQFFSDLTIVGATPIFDLDGKTTIGVLAASSKQAIDPGDETSAKSQLESALETTARVLAVTLVAYDLEGAPSQ